MTTYGSVKATCCMCHCKSVQTTLGSTNRTGASDLDFRPPEMLRSTMAAWIQACPNCGYVAEQIETEPLSLDVVRRVVAGDRWLELTTRWKGPDLASVFLRRAALEQELGRPHFAAASTVSAAWVADDTHDTVRAIEFREAAAHLMKLALERSDLDGKARRVMQVRLVDVLRRAGAWSTAGRHCDDLLASSPDGVVGIMLRFQTNLIREGDADCHSIGQALAWGRPPPAPDPDGGQQPREARRPAPWSSPRHLLRWLRR